VNFSECSGDFVGGVGDFALAARGACGAVSPRAAGVRGRAMLLMMVGVDAGEARGVVVGGAVWVCARRAVWSRGQFPYQIKRLVARRGGARSLLCFLVRRANGHPKKVMHRLIHRNGVGLYRVVVKSLWISRRAWFLPCRFAAYKQCAAGGGTLFEGSKMAKKLSTG